MLWCGLRVNTVAVKGHRAPSKDDGSLKWALLQQPFSTRLAPRTRGGLVGPSSWAGLVTGGGEKEMNGLNVRRGGGVQKERRASLCIDRCVFVLDALYFTQPGLRDAAPPVEIAY